MSRALFTACVALTLCAHARPAQDSAAARSRPPTLRPANVLQELKRHKARRPGIKPAALARYANALLARGGFDYNFDVCEIFPPGMLADARTAVATGALHTFRRRLTRLDGRGVTFDLVAYDFGAPCGECYLTVPALRVTKGEMTLVAGGAAYGLKRPASFKLDEAQLLDPSMKRVLRSWHLPYQTIPAGVSPDGRSLYLGFNTEHELEELLLELSEDGRLRFRVAEGTPPGADEWVTERPEGAPDAFEGYKRFRSGGRTHVVRFTGPCT